MRGAFTTRHHDLPLVRVDDLLQLLLAQRADHETSTIFVFHLVNFLHPLCVLMVGLLRVGLVDGVARAPTSDKRRQRLAADFELDGGGLLARGVCSVCLTSTRH